MKSQSFKAAASLAVGLMSATLLTTGSAQALTNFTRNYVKDGTHLPTCGGYHVASGTGTTGPAQQDLVVNAPPKSIAWSGTNTLQDATTPTPNSAKQTWSMNATAGVTANGALPKSISLTWDARYTMTAPASANCFGNPDLFLQNEFNFTTRQPLIVTMAYHKDGHGYAETYIENSNDTSSYEDDYGQELSGSLTDKFYLPAGTYDGYVEGDLDQAKFTTGSVSSTGSASISFAVPGSATSGPSGAAARYVSMSRTRACATNSLRTAITSNRLLVKQIAKVIYVRNGRVAKTVLGAKPGMVVNVTGLSSTAAASVRVTVVLKNGKRLTESANYLPCIV